MSLTDVRIGYKPFSYPWAFQAWKKQQEIHWMPEEIPFSDDIIDWEKKLTTGERELLTHIFRFFTQSDIEVFDNYMDRYASIFKPTEIKMMLAAFTGMETVHIHAYSHLLETIGMPATEYNAFMNYKEMKDKHDFMQSFKADDPYSIALTMAVFGGFIEGLSLFASFAILLNFPRFNKMKGMGQVITWSVRDESLHCEAITKLFHTYVYENRKEINLKKLEQDLRYNLDIVINCEDAFIDLAFGNFDIKGTTKEKIKSYIRHVGNIRYDNLANGLLGHQVPFPDHMIHPLRDWLPQALNSVEHANFFESRATEYAKAAVTGNWQKDVWDKIDTYNNNLLLTAAE